MSKRSDLHSQFRAYRKGFRRQYTNPVGAVLSGITRAARGVYGKIVGSSIDVVGDTAEQLLSASPHDFSDSRVSSIPASSSDVFPKDSLPFRVIDTAVIRRARRLDTKALMLATARPAADSASAGVGTAAPIAQETFPQEGIGKALAIAKILRDPDFFAGGFGYIETPDSGKRFVKKQFTASSAETGAYAGSKDVLIAPGEDIKPEKKAPSVPDAVSTETEAAAPETTDRFASLSFSTMTQEQKKEFLDTIASFIEAKNPSEFLKTTAAEVMPLEAAIGFAAQLSEFDYDERKAELKQLYSKELTRQRAIDSAKPYDMSQYFKVKTDRAAGTNVPICQPTYLGRLAIADYYAEKYGIEIIPTTDASSTTKIMKAIKSREGDFRVGILASSASFWASRVGDYDLMPDHHNVPIIYERKDGKESIYVSDSAGYHQAMNLIQQLKAAFPGVEIEYIGKNSRQADSYSCMSDGLSFLKEMLKVRDIDSASAFYATAKRAQKLDLLKSTGFTEDQTGRLKKHREKHTAMSVSVTPIEDRIQNLALNEKGYFYRRVVAAHFAGKTAEDIAFMTAKHRGLEDILRVLRDETISLQDRAEAASLLYKMALTLNDPQIVQAWKDENPELARKIIVHVKDCYKDLQEDLKSIITAADTSEELRTQAKDALITQLMMVPIESEARYDLMTQKEILLAFMRDHNISFTEDSLRSLMSLFSLKQYSIGKILSVTEQLGISNLHALGQEGVKFIIDSLSNSTDYNLDMYNRQKILSLLDSSQLREYRDADGNNYIHLLMQELGSVSNIRSIIQSLPEGHMDLLTLDNAQSKSALDLVLDNIEAQYFVRPDNIIPGDFVGFSSAQLTRAIEKVDQIICDQTRAKSFQFTLESFAQFKETLQISLGIVKSREACSLEASVPTLPASATSVEAESLSSPTKKSSVLRAPALAFSGGEEGRSLSGGGTSSRDTESERLIDLVASISADIESLQSTRHNVAKAQPKVLECGQKFKEAVKLYRSQHSMLSDESKKSLEALVVDTEQLKSRSGFMKKLVQFVKNVAKWLKIERKPLSKIDEMYDQILKKDNFEKPQVKAPKKKGVSTGILTNTRRTFGII